MKEKINEYKLLLRSIPSLVVALYVVGVVCMNLLANKTIVSIGDWFALDGGIVVSWIIFMCMDVVTKHFGPKAATRLSIVAIIVNLLCCAVFFIVSIIPTVEDYSGFNTIFGGTWFILMDSTIAFLISGVTNNYLNDFIGTFFKHAPDSKKAFVTRTYISTFVGQFFDNLIFAIPTFMIFAPIFWDGFSWTLTQCVTCSLSGAVAELLMEILFSPLGYKMCMCWKKDGVGKEYIDNYVT